MRDLRLGIVQVKREEEDGQRYLDMKDRAFGVQ